MSAILIILSSPETQIQAMKSRHQAKIKVSDALQTTTRSTPSRLISGLLLSSGAIFQTLLWLSLLNVDRKIFREHGPMENFQAACLVIAAILWVSALKENKNPGTRLMAYGVIFLHVNFFISEFDVRPFGIAWLNFLFKGAFRNAWLAAGWLCIFLLLARHAKATWSASIKWLVTGSGKLMLTAGIFWVLGWIVDKSKPFPSHDQSLMAEELLETNAVFFMVFSAIYFFQSNKVVAQQQALEDDKCKPEPATK